VNNVRRPAIPARNRKIIEASSGDGPLLRAVPTTPVTVQAELGCGGLQTRRPCTAAQSHPAGHCASDVQVLEQTVSASLDKQSPELQSAPITHRAPTGYAPEATQAVTRPSSVSSQLPFGAQSSAFWQSG
jgi:hypothetical protein